MDSKVLFVAFVLLASASAAPSALLAAPLPLAYTAPAFATASSSQVVARNYNGLAPVAPVVPAAPYVAAPAAPYVSPYAAPFAAPYAAPFPSPLAYSAPYLW